MKRRVRIKDIADKAGVSTGTVDRVLHERGNVAAEVKEKVLNVVKELGYERNLLASALAYNKTVRIIALIPTPSKDPYWEQVHTGVQKAQKAVQHYGLLTELIFFDYFNPKSFLSVAESALQKTPDGILYPPMFSHEAQWLFEECDKQDINTVFINTNLPGTNPLCYIGQDSYQSGVLGARLLDFGLNNEQSICILNLDYSTKAAYHLLDKERGFRDYFKAHNKKTEIFRKDFDQFENPKNLSRFLSMLLKDYPRLSGIFVTNSRGHKIVDTLDEIAGRQIKIVGFDLIEKNLEALRQNKISFLINQNPADQGSQGIVSLFKHLILNEKVEPIQYLPLDIVVKENAEYYLNKHKILEIIS